MLTPAKTDPNRTAELKRQQVSPTEFGTSAINNIPKDWKESGLKPPRSDQPKIRK